MGKLTWTGLGRIWEGQYLVTPKEASEILAREILDKNWKGTQKTHGRMWSDSEIVQSFCVFLYKLDSAAKKKKIKSGVLLKEWHDKGHKELDYFTQTCSLRKYKSFKNLANDIGMWRKLPFVKGPKHGDKAKLQMEKYRAYLKKIKDKDDELFKKNLLRPSKK